MTRPPTPVLPALRDLPVTVAWTGHESLHDYAKRLADANGLTLRGLLGRRVRWPEWRAPGPELVERLSVASGVPEDELFAVVASRRYGAAIRQTPLLGLPDQKGTDCRLLLDILALDDPRAREIQRDLLSHRALPCYGCTPLVVDELERLAGHVMPRLTTRWPRFGPDDDLALRRRVVKDPTRKLPLDQWSHQVRHFAIVSLGTSAGLNPAHEIDDQYYLELQMHQAWSRVARTVRRHDPRWARALASAARQWPSPPPRAVPPLTTLHPQVHHPGPLTLPRATNWPQPALDILALLTWIIWHPQEVEDTLASNPIAYTRYAPDPMPLRRAEVTALVTNDALPDLVEQTIALAAHDPAPLPSHQLEGLQHMITHRLMLIAWRAHLDLSDLLAAAWIDMTGESPPTGQPGPRPVKRLPQIDRSVLLQARREIRDLVDPPELRIPAGTRARRRTRRTA